MTVLWALSWGCSYSSTDSCPTRDAATDRPADLALASEAGAPDPFTGVATAVPLGRVNFTRAVAGTVAAGDNSIALFADKSLALVDLAEPTAPILGPEGVTDGKVVAAEFDESMGLAYAADATGKVYVFSARTIDGFAKLYEAFSASLVDKVMGVARLGSTLYLLTGDSIIPVTFTFNAAGAPDGSRFGAAIALGGLASFIAAGGDSVYVALKTATGGEVHAWSVPEIGSAARLGQFALQGEPRTLLAKGSKVLVAAAGVGLSVVDFGNPRLPVQLAIERSLHDVSFARLFGRTLAVGLDRKLISTIDLSNFAAPRVLTVDQGALPQYLAVVGGVLFHGTGTTATVSNVPPTVSVSPPPLVAGDFPLHGQVPVTFGKTIDPATAISAYVTLTCGTVRISGRILVSPTRTALTFVPDQLLPASTSCTLDLSGVKDAHGQGVVGGTVAVSTAAQPSQAITIPGSKFAHTPDGQFTDFDAATGDNAGEWSDVTPAKGMYTYFYGDYKGGKLNILNDWFFNGDKIDPDCYNEFYVWTGGGSEHWTIRAYAGRKVTVLKDGDVLDPAAIGVSGSAGFGPSPNVKEPHTIYELQIPAKSGTWGVQLHDPGPTYHCSRLASEPTSIQGTLGVGSTTGGVTIDSTGKPLAPSAPILLLPANGTSTGTVTPTLVWSAPGSELLSMLVYQVQISKVSTFANLVWNISTGYTSYTVPSGVLGSDKTYYWRIIASNAAGQAESSLSSFSTGKPIFVADAGIDVQLPPAKEAGILDVGQTDLPPDGSPADKPIRFTDAPPDAPADAGLTRALTVTLTNTAGGTGAAVGTSSVTSEPAGISCTSSGGTCSTFFDVGSTVYLFARTTAGWHFVSWGGDCPDETASQIKLSITAGQEPIACVARFEADVPDGSVITTDAGGACTATSEVAACTNGTTPEINLGALDATACRERCPAAMVAAGMKSGCWVVALDTICYCRDGSLRGGGTAWGGTCVLGTSGSGGAGGSGGMTGLGGAGGVAGMTGSGGAGGVAGMTGSGGAGGVAGMTGSGGAGGVAGMTGMGGTGSGGNGSGGTSNAGGAGPGVLLYTGTPTALAADTKYLYIGQSGENGIRRIGLTSTAAGTGDLIVPSVTVPTDGLALGSSYVYWVSGKNILRAPRDGMPTGGAPETVAQVSNSVLFLGSNASDSSSGTHLFWADGTLEGADIYTLALSGGDPILIASGVVLARSTPLRADLSYLYWIASPSGTSSNVVYQSPLGTASPAQVGTDTGMKGLGVAWGGPAYLMCSSANCTLRVVGLDGNVLGEATGLSRYLTGVTASGNLVYPYESSMAYVTDFSSGSPVTSPLAGGYPTARTFYGSIRGFFYFTTTEVRKAVAPGH